VLYDYRHTHSKRDSKTGGTTYWGIIHILAKEWHDYIPTQTRLTTGYIMLSHKMKWERYLTAASNTRCTHKKQSAAIPHCRKLPICEYLLHPPENNAKYLIQKAHSNVRITKTLFPMEYETILIGSQDERKFSITHLATVQTEYRTSIILHYAQYHRRRRIHKSKWTTNPIMGHRANNHMHSSSNMQCGMQNPNVRHSSDTKKDIFGSREFNTAQILLHMHNRRSIMYMNDTRNYYG